MIIDPVRDILTQISFASSFLFLFQWWLIQCPMTRRSRGLPDEQSILIICCAVGITFCTMLSSTLFGVVYLSLAILPAYIGILYGNFRSAISLALFFMICTALFSSPAGVTNIVINSGVLMYPLLFGLNKPFKRRSLYHKVGILWVVLVPSMLFIILLPEMDGRNIYNTHAVDEFLVTMYLFITILLGGLLIFCIETVWDRLQFNQQMKGISERLKLDSEKLQQITEAVQLNILSIDDNGYVTELNEFMLKLIHRHNPEITREQILSQPAAQLFRRNLDDQTFARLQNVIRNKQRSNAKVKCDKWTYQVYIAPLQHDSGIPGEVVMIFQDLTEEENLRSELDNVERLTLVGQMAAGITHEIRNPMAVVRGFLQLMREKSPGELDSYYHIVMDELDRANGIINDFLSLAQSRVSDKEMVQLQLIVEELSPLIWADANLRGQSIELKLNPSLPVLRLNVKEIKQLVLNLARNAMEAMEPKGVLTLETRINGDNVELIVSDTGGGISQSQLEKLFVPFFTTKSHGTGLGLSLCQSIAERHHGKITVQSKEGLGTEFTVSFPCELKLGATLTDSKG